ncbi:hypothetical protein JTE90_014466 [Oedothorax gibbosus]|uniref:Uncharacterized protein n=1 Tax=Oedothorax gibbosus TaxID=931172 RepID=A0AAV6VKZ2_9ARAC|nr:hypothetical protein JTE90_014466 [Oedothorax gibbosus]
MYNSFKIKPIHIHSPITTIITQSQPLLRFPQCSEFNIINSKDWCNRNFPRLLDGSPIPQNGRKGVIPNTPLRLNYFLICSQEDNGSTEVTGHVYTRWPLVRFFGIRRLSMGYNEINGAINGELFVSVVFWEYNVRGGLVCIV